MGRWGGGTATHHTVVLLQRELGEVGGELVVDQDAAVEGARLQELIEPFTPTWSLATSLASWVLFLGSSAFSESS